jgi:hypothetical protein
MLDYRITSNALRPKEMNLVSRHIVAVREFDALIVNWAFACFMCGHMKRSCCSETSPFNGPCKDTCHHGSRPASCSD